MRKRVGQYIDAKVMILICDSDYKDDGTNILLDANENAFGPSLELDRKNGLRNGQDHRNISALIDFYGLHRYPDPYIP